MSHRLEIRHLAILAVVMAGCGKADVATKPLAASPQASDPTATAPVKTTNLDPTAKAANSSPTPTVKSDTPQMAVQEFMEALRIGNETTAVQLLSSAAREKMAAGVRRVGTPPSDTAKFSVGKVEYVNDDGARVFCTWTDVDENGKSSSDEIIWGVRKESEGWRIAGVATPVFPGEPPLFLNFEDPEEMARRYKWAKEEMVRRANEASERSAEAGENPEKTLRR